MKNNKNIASLFNEDIYSNKVKPLITYNNSLLNKFNALDDNIGKSGIYRFANNRNNKSYVGSSKDLCRRFKDYYDIDFLKRRVLTSNSLIYRALLDEGYGNFTLEILEYCDKNIRFEREQLYMDLLKPEYNIQSIAGIILSPRGSSTTVVNKKDGSLKTYCSMYAAAKDINVKYTTIKYYVNKDKLLKGTYLISSK
jgi:hypothetical protein